MLLKLTADNRKNDYELMIKMRDPSQKSNMSVLCIMSVNILINDKLSIQNLDLKLSILNYFLKYE